MTSDFNNVDLSSIWNKFADKFAINNDQIDQFKKYFDLILQENQKYNITAITGSKEIILDHFYDSLSLLLFSKANLKTIKSIVDVGSGGGFPGIPLAIMFPHIQFNLIEVNNKKVHFLKLVATELGLNNITVHTDDWRTFLRIFKQPVDLFIARASLQVSELIRIFKPSSIFQKSMLVYWASKKWVPTEEEKEYLDECLLYLVGDKERNLCFFNHKALK
ncbi:MAG: 16S rRNA (guanine(527)-N(7))-methyltransferase RsmG [Candidatus Dependentiae bacterium]|nr:16S rRNA (guanine(527)-N(7))-methyltransferase RsmG [Candidatus Dependentiae bacterium]